MIKYYGLFFLIVVISLILFYHTNKEGFINLKYNLANADDYSNTQPLLSDTYTYTGNIHVNENTHNDIWWQKPIFEVGSYKQITNNLRYRRNPDDGECRTADFCGVFYEDNQNETNYSKPLPPAPEISPGVVRVNYYNTDSNLILGQQLGPQLQTF